MSLIGMEAVLFDMDGTLFDSEQLWDISIADLAVELGGTLSPQARRRVIGGNLHDTARIVHADVGVDAEAARSAAWLLQRTNELFALGVPWRPGARELVDSVRSAGIRTALVTSSYRLLVDTVLAQLDADLFDVVVCGDEVISPKPSPEPYLVAAARLGVRAGNCVALEDSARGIAAARAAGCLVVAVPEEHQPPTAGDDVISAPLEALSADRLAELMARR